MIFFAVAAPTPGSASSCAWDAVFRSTGPWLGAAFAAEWLLFVLPLFELLLLAHAAGAGITSAEASPSARTAIHVSCPRSVRPSFEIHGPLPSRPVHRALRSPFRACDGVLCRKTYHLGASARRKRLQAEARRHAQGLAGDAAGLVRGQECGGRGDLLRLDHALERVWRHVEIALDVRGGAAQGRGAGAGPRGH